MIGFSEPHEKKEVLGKEQKTTECTSVHHFSPFPEKKELTIHLSDGHE